MELWIHEETGRETVMETLDNRELSDEQINRVNMCRMRMKIHHQEDLLTEDGRGYLPGVL